MIVWHIVFEIRAPIIIQLKVLYIQAILNSVIPNMGSTNEAWL